MDSGAHSLEGLILRRWRRSPSQSHQTKANGAYFLAHNLGHLRLVEVCTDETLKSLQFVIMGFNTISTAISSFLYLREELPIQEQNEELPAFDRR